MILHVIEIKANVKLYSKSVLPLYYNTFSIKKIFNKIKYIYFHTDLTEIWLKKQFDQKTGTKLKCICMILKLTKNKINLDLQNALKLIQIS